MSIFARHIGIAAAGALLIAAIDQGVKRLVTGMLPLGGSHPLIPGIVDLNYQQNMGTAFSMFRTVPMPVLVLVSLLVLGIFFALVYPHLRTRWGMVAAILVLGGALGNLYDRIFRFDPIRQRSYVVDYIDIHVWPVFNVADMCIVIGIAALAIVILRAERGPASPGGDAQ